MCSCLYKIDITAGLVSIREEAVVYPTRIAFKRR